ncbi:MAG: carboxylating nicotinate-nucleotide diphosphorylase [Gemmataceae bacterium]|jgi:nicotinate-nucleotide pyrophosphorylase (carboxylating)
MTFSSKEKKCFDVLLDLAIAEDLEPSGDLTSKATLSEDLVGKATLVSRAEGVLAGSSAGEFTFAEIAPKAQWFGLVSDGTKIQKGTELAKIQGPIRSILAAERIALNFMQRLSGIASLTKKYTDAVQGIDVKILDTRKTEPGWRILDKYAVRCGGGHNHRMSLCDGILIKDNHLAALGGGPASIRKAILLARQFFSGNWDIEVEVDNLEMFDTALQSTPSIILLDNMSIPDMSEAVKKRNAIAPSVALEASGGIQLANLREIALTGVDRISIGALTHSAPALDLALDYTFE